ncbi:SRPBCC family protein [Luteimonas sp. MC1825]|uniref:SRPBCC family protein n=1 Tax=Luteimonas sp. MC1825 TaxID=2761107 RepID=UPI001614FB28|nr:SRPBCC family protein [Luteimonas sp. MC1825]MBB6598839.1 SRPBCC family protein [Luteimonas sp. MC1825]QOC88992.1 SRPBCC family protein [Luteimonas sp. MC1825]
MTRLLELLISIAIVAVLFVIVGVLLPSSRHLSESVETNRRLSIVFDTINSFRRFDDWHPLALGNVQLNRSGPDSGVGARIDYKSEVSNGSWEIVESDEDQRVVYAIQDEKRGSDKRSVFTLKPTGRNNRNVEITQTYDVKYGWDLLGRYAGLYVSRNIGDSVKLGLGRLSNMLASVPNIDYRAADVRLSGLEFVDVPAEHLLVVNAGAVERNNEKIKTSMKANAEWIKRTMDANGLVAAGPLRIVSTEFARDTYTFDVVQPVRRRAAGAPAPAAAAADGEGADAAAQQAEAEAAPAVAATEALTGLNLMGPVTYAHSEATRVATGDYVGYMAELDNVRNAVRAWTLTQGEEVIGRPYELYKNGIDQAFTADGEFEVRWVLKR